MSELWLLTDLMGLVVIYVVILSLILRRHVLTNIYGDKSVPCTNYCLTTSYSHCMFSCQSEPLTLHSRRPYFETCFPSSNRRKIKHREIKSMTADVNSLHNIPWSECPMVNNLYAYDHVLLMKQATVRFSKGWQSCWGKLKIEVW